LYDGQSLLRPYSVKFEPKGVDSRIVDSGVQYVGNDLLAKVFVDESGRRKLCLKAVPKYFGEPSLVMIETLFSFVVYTTDVYDDGTRIEDGWISGSHEIGIRVIASLAKEIDRQSFIAMKRSVVSTDDLFYPLLL